MSAVIKLFWNICLLRIGPELVPTRADFIAALVAALLAVETASLAIAAPAIPVLLALNMALIGIACTAAISWFALHVRRVEERFPATLGAIAGSKALIGSALALAQAFASGAVLQSVSAVLLIWSLIVVGFILCRALSCRLWVGILLSAGMWMLGFLVMAAALDQPLRDALGA